MLILRFLHSTNNMKLETEPDKKLYRFIESRVKDEGKHERQKEPAFTPYGVTQKHIEKIKQASGAILAISDMLRRFQVDDECESLIPEAIKSDFNKVTMLDAVNLLADTIGESAEYLEKLHLK